MLFFLCAKALHATEHLEHKKTAFVMTNTVKCSAREAFVTGGDVRDRRRRSWPAPAFVAGVIRK